MISTSVVQLLTNKVKKGEFIMMENIKKFCSRNSGDIFACCLDLMIILAIMTIPYLKYIPA